MSKAKSASEDLWRWSACDFADSSINRC